MSSVDCLPRPAFVQPFNPWLSQRSPKCHDRDEWMASSWLELVNPTADVGRRETKLSLEEKVRKAANRGQDNLRRQRHLPVRFLQDSGNRQVLANISLEDMPRELHVMWEEYSYDAVPADSELGML